MILPPSRKPLLIGLAVTCLSASALARGSPLDEPNVARGGSDLAERRAFRADTTLTLAQNAPTSQKGSAAGKPKSEPPKKSDSAKAPKDASLRISESPEIHESGAYHEISDFFNVREANASVHKGEWEFEIEAEWVTASGGDDDIENAYSLKYGITDQFFAEIEVLPMNYGDGGDQGSGDLALILFYQWLKETDAIPAFATWAEMRIPTGEGSSGVDGELHFNLTKTLFPQFRAHLEGYIMTANGARGGDEERRPFQWGVGPGVDYLINDQTIIAMNYINRSSEHEGVGNQNILEFGMAREIVHGQTLKLAVDVGLDDNDDTDNFAVKLLYAIEWE